MARKGRGKAEKARGKHDGAMFGEGKWEFRRMLEHAKVATACDCLGFLARWVGQICRRKTKRDFIPLNARDGAEVSLRRPTHSQERKRKKKPAWAVQNDRGG